MFEDVAATRALILSFLAGMSTLLGAFIIFLTNKKSEKLVTISLGFAGGVMISVSFTDLMPNANILLAAYAGDKMGVVLGVIFLLIGVLLAAMLDKLFPMKMNLMEMENSMKIFSELGLYLLWQ